MRAISLLPLTLSLFVFLILADHPHDTGALDDLALVTNPFD
jgi:hypothetical protein